MARSNDEIYELVKDLDKKFAVHLAVHAERETKAARKWQIKLTMLGALLAVPMATIAIVISAVKG